MLLASSEQGLQLALDRFPAARDRAGMHCNMWRSSSTLGWYWRVTEGGMGRLIHGLVNQTHFCVSFITLWSQNGSFQTPQNCEFLYWPFSDPHLWSSILGNGRNNIIPSASGRDGIFAKSSRRDTSRQNAQLWNPQNFVYRATSPNREIPATFVQPRGQNATGKTGEASPAG